MSPLRIATLSAVLLAGGAAAAPPAATSQSGNLQRGKYLVTIGGCNDCHTPWKMGPKGPAPDMTRMLSGHPSNVQMPRDAGTLAGPWTWVGAATMTAFQGPWGTSFAGNLTPSKQAGIGGWTESGFVTAMRTGKHLHTGKPILPPMPWQNVGHMTDEDLASVFAYLRSIPPIDNRVPEAIPAPTAPKP